MRDDTDSFEICQADAIIESNARIPVTFHQHGTWGGRSFLAALCWSQDELFGNCPMLRILDIPENEGWAGLMLLPGQVMPGRYAAGGASTLSGKYYMDGGGSLQIGDPPHNLTRGTPPAEVFAGRPGYLHTELTILTDGQRQLALEAIRYDKPRHETFSPGATLLRHFTREEVEGAKLGQIAYNYPDTEGED